MSFRKNLTAAATGSTSYSLGDRDENWDADAAEKAMTPAQLPQMHFWRDPDKDVDQVGAYKLPFATPDPSPHAVWAGVTAVAAALQGSRGGVSIPDADVAGVKSRVAGYYSKARDKYKDDTIQPPWKATVAPSAQHAAEMAAAGLYWKGDSWTFEQMAEGKHGYKGDGGPCAICGEPPTNKDNHFAADGVDLADTPPASDKPHAYQGDGTEPCTVCGQAADSDVHQQPAQTAVAGARWQSTLLTEGALSRDGRMIAPGASFWGEMPITLMGMMEDTGLGGHSGSQVTGQMQTIERVGNDIVSTGTFDTSDWAQNIQRLVQDGTMKGISVDLAPVEWRIEAKPMEEEAGGMLLLADGEPDDGREVVAEERMDDMVFVVTKGEIMGATICPMPAFANAEIHLSADGQPEMIRLYGSIALVADAEDGDAEATALNPVASSGSMICLYPEPDQAQSLADPDGNLPPESLHCTLFYFPEAPDDGKLHTVLSQFAQKYDAISGMVGGCGMFAPSPDDGDLGAPEILLVKAQGLADLRAELASELSTAGMPFSTRHDGFTPHITVDYGDPDDYISNPSLLGSPLSFRAISYVSGSARTDYPFISSLTASAAGLVPEAPPAAWFDNPKLTEPTGLTITPEGRVYGHAASWNVCHIAHSDACITAPHSTHDYGYFMLGELETAEGERIAVGQVTFDTGHAPDSYARQKTRAHYDDTGTAVADVAVGEDEHGIWMAGALRADATAGQVRKLQGAKISGDWRDVNGSLELVALLAVNVPGFPVPRPKAQLRRQGTQVKGLALVAAGIIGENHAPPTRVWRADEKVALRVMAARAEGGIDALAKLAGL